jgi:hypothetical protein
MTPGYDPILDGSAAPHWNLTMWQSKSDGTCEVEFPDGTRGLFADYDAAIQGCIDWAKANPDPPTSGEDAG